MKKVTVIINGEEYIARPKNEPAAAEKPKTGYERCDSNSAYFSCDDFGDVDSWIECNDNSDERYYNTGNYYNNETLIKNIIRADTLMRKLRQWQALNDEPVDWSDTDTREYCVWYDYYDSEFRIGSTFSVRHIGQIYFSSVEKAREAIEVFKDELTWYFTEYQQRLDEPKKSEGTLNDK